MEKQIKDSFAEAGAVEEGKVPVDVSYDIIRHVSAQLYTTPRKAIEELICNSYDAGASECHVTLPLKPQEPLICLDNGRSMDFDGITLLWQVAKSPKARDDDEPRVANQRMQIGKFGVGKLATFALGNRLTHITCVNRIVRVISVGQQEIRESGTGEAPSFEVYRLPLNRAKPLVTPLLNDLPKPWERNWSRWTLAMVEDIDSSAIGQALRIGLLRRMISTALPVSAKFKVSLQGEAVPRRTIPQQQIEVSVDVIDDRFRHYLSQTLQDFWANKLDQPKDDVATSLFNLKVISVANPENINKKVKGIAVPGLGAVSGKGISTKTSLTTEKLQERGYTNNGFAITSYGKLINPEDPLFGITQRSHKYWSKFLAQIEIPGLDKVLLVQRNAVSENSDEAQIAREVLKALFNYTRNLVEALEETVEYDPGSFGSRLGSSSPILAQAALKGLLRGSVSPDDLGELNISFGTFGAAGAAVRFDEETKTIVINEEHPLLTSLDVLGALSKPLRRVVGEVLGGIELSQGYLWLRGVKEEIIADVEEVIDASLRSAAEFVRDPVEEHIDEIRNASFEGDTPFEKAVVEAFRSLRLAATHQGESDEPDGIIEIPQSGRDNLRISVEAKGSNGVITHKQLSEATVRRHSGDSACQYAVAIAREFQTKGRSGKRSALLRETENRVPLLTVAGIEKMLRLHKRRNFTYDKVAKILLTWKHPDELEDFIEQTWREVPEPGLMRLILEVAHEFIKEDSTNLPDPGMIIGDYRVRKLRIKKPDVITILQSVAITTRMITIRNPEDCSFELHAPVDTILDAMQKSYQME